MMNSISIEESCAESGANNSSSMQGSLPRVLPLLQDNIKRDPAAYAGDFQLQFSQFQSLVSLLQQQPQRLVKGLQQLLMFLAHTSPCYSPSCAAGDGSNRNRNSSKKKHTRRGNKYPLRSIYVNTAAEDGAAYTDAFMPLASGGHAQNGDAPPLLLWSSPAVAADAFGSCSNRNYSGELVNSLLQVLLNYSSTLHPITRQVFLNALLLLRRKNQISCTQMLQVAVRLLQLKDKACRETLFSFITRDVAKVCCVDNMQQSFARISPVLFEMLAKPASSLAARLALCALIQVYRQQRNRARAAGGGGAIQATSADNKGFLKLINAVASCTLAADIRLATSAALFLLGELTDAATRLGKVEDEGEVDIDDPNEEDKAAAAAAVAAAADEKKRLLRVKAGFGKKTLASKKKLKRIKARIQKQVARKQIRIDQQQQHGAVVASTSIIDLLYDPQTLAEKLLARARSQGTLPFSFRLILLNLISRLIGHHKLLLLNFYPFMQKYLQPHQRVVSSVLAYLATGVHELVPPLELRPIIKHIADNFVDESRTEEIVAIGLNAITEICARAPLCMTSELLADLVEYRKERKRGKAAVLAARRLMNLYRDVMPNLLPSNARGKEASIALQTHQTPEIAYGKFQPAEDVAGAKELEQLRKLVLARERLKNETNKKKKRETDSESEDEKNRSEDEEGDEVGENSDEEEEVEEAEFESEEDGSVEKGEEELSEGEGDEGCGEASECEEKGVQDGKESWNEKRGKRTVVELKDTGQTATTKEGTIFFTVEEVNEASEKGVPCSGAAGTEEENKQKDGATQSESTNLTTEKTDTGLTTAAQMSIEAPSRAAAQAALTEAASTEAATKTDVALTDASVTDAGTTTAAATGLTAETKAEKTAVAATAAAVEEEASAAAIKAAGAKEAENDKEPGLATTHTPEVFSSSVVVGTDRVFTRAEFLALKLLKARNDAAAAGGPRGKKRRLAATAAAEEGEEGEADRLLLSLIEKSTTNKKKKIGDTRDADDRVNTNHSSEEEDGGEQLPIEAYKSDSNRSDSDEENGTCFVSSIELEGLAGQKRRQQKERNRMHEEKLQRKREKLLKRVRAGDTTAAAAAAASPWPFERKRQEAAAASVATFRGKKGKTVATGNAPQHVKARNKPIAMIRQSRKLRQKKQHSVSQKVQNLKRHIKNLKKSQIGRPRRRKR